MRILLAILLLAACAIWSFLAACDYGFQGAQALYDVWKDEGMNDPILSAIIHNWQLSLAFLVTMGMFAYGYVESRRECEDGKNPWLKIAIAIIGLIGYIDCLTRLP